MRLMTEREQIKRVAEEWKRQQGNVYERPKRIYDALLALDTEKATAKVVETIIGNDDWVKPHPCDECGGNFYELVDVGEEEHRESRTAGMCLDCLKKAVALLESAE